jgi:hypothetical protein
VSEAVSEAAAITSFATDTLFAAFAAAAATETSCRYCDGDGSGCVGAWCCFRCGAQIAREIKPNVEIEQKNHNQNPTPHETKKMATAAISMTLGDVLTALRAQNGDDAASARDA